MVELKKEINYCCLLNGQQPRYPLNFEQENGNGSDET
jgi:hypothetical protein